MPPETIVAALRRWAAAEPDRPAYHLLGDDNQITASLSYGLLDRQAQTIAVQIAQRQLPPDACVLVMYPEGLDFIAAFMGCLYAGVAAVPAPFAGTLRPGRHKQRLRAIVADARAALILTTTAGSKAIDLPTPLLTTDMPDRNNTEEWKPAIDKHSVAYIQYNSSSTDAPRGIVVTHTNLAHNLADQHVAWGYDADSAVLTWMPHVHDFGLVEGLLRPLASGIPCTIMSPGAFVRHPALWLQAISRYRITHSGGATFGFDWCIRQISPDQRQGLDLSSWQVAVIGAEPIQPEVIERFVAGFAPYGFRADTFCPSYGLGEVTLLATAKPKGASLAFRNLAVGPRETRIIGCGHPHGNGRMLIVDPDTCHPCGAGEVGEIWIAGPSVAAGYWQRPEETQKTFQAYLADSDEGPFLRSGDLGLLDQGALFITGRLKDMIIIRGQNYYPQDIEWAIAKCHPAIEGYSAAVFGVTADGAEQIVIAQEVDPRHQSKPTWERIIQAIRQTVAEQFELPVQAVVLLKRGDLPKTSSGKIQRYTCRAEFLAGEWAPVAEWRQPPHDGPGDIKPDSADLTTRLTLLWQALLQTPVGPDDNFFALGGDSLTAPRMLLQVEKQFGVKVPMEFFTQPTVTHLAQLVSGGTEAVGVSPSDANRQKPAPQVTRIEPDSADLTTRLTLLWQTLLQTPVGTDDNFFALGGDSLTALHMLLQVEEQFGVKVPMEFFSQPTITHLARLVSGGTEAVGVSPSDVNRQKPVPQVTRKERLNIQRLREYIISTGPIWRRHGLPYGPGVRMQRALLALPSVQKALFAKEIVLLRRWGERAKAGLDATAILQSLLANTWNGWRNRALVAPLGTSPWVTMQGVSSLWKPQQNGQGVIFLLMHSHLSMIFLHSLAADGHSPLFIRGYTGETGKREQDRSIQVYRAHQILRRGGMIIIGGDGGKGQQGVIVPFFGGQRLFRQGGAELAVQTGALLVPVFCTMATDGQVTIEVSPPLAAGDGSIETKVETLTRAYADLVVTRWPQVYPSLTWDNLARWQEKLSQGIV